MKLRKIRRSVRIVRTVRTENGFTDREILCPGSHIWLAQINTASYINGMSFLSKIIFVLRTVGDGFLVIKSVCDIVRRFIAVFYSCYSMSNNDMALNVIGNKYTKCAISNSDRQHAK